MNPDDWQALIPGQGSCFHQALHRWALLHANGEQHFKIAVGIVRANPYDLKRHLHAWLEREQIVISAVSGESFERFA